MRPKSVYRRSELVKSICDYLKDNSTSRITLDILGEEFGVSPFHLQRVFTDVMGMSPRRYLEEYRLGDLRRRLAKGESVVKALRGTGYSAQSWLYDDSKRRLGMTPGTYRNGGPGILISYAIGDSPIGRLLVATTVSGICAVKVGRYDAELVKALKCEFPRARIREWRNAQRYVRALIDHLGGQETRFPLDIGGTDFQMKVWSALRGIPRGQTRSYSDVAMMVGDTKAVRAVANACASNPVPLIIPCHRVIRKDGTLGGYALGIARKKLLLAKEKAIIERQKSAR
jgi:AraC family transcriptional regulator of adaptative response/methylated-DNA-[protein]-cysteine methyltransferase